MHCFLGAEGHWLSGFSKVGLDLAVVEVGMGGRLDSTNIIEPIVSVLTNVTVDHQAYLGNTVEKIGLENWS